MNTIRSLLVLILLTTEACLASAPPGQVAIHRTCSYGDKTEDVVTLPWWQNAVDQGRQPVCVRRLPLEDLKVTKVTLVKDRAERGLLLTLHCEPSQEQRLYEITRGLVGQQLAIVVRAKILAVPLVVRPQKGAQLQITVESKEKGEALRSILEDDH